LNGIVLDLLLAGCNAPFSPMADGDGNVQIGCSAEEADASRLGGNADGSDRRAVGIALRAVVRSSAYVSRNRMVLIENFAARPA
jgi:hypothetical protein